MKCALAFKSCQLIAFSAWEYLKILSTLDVRYMQASVDRDWKALLQKEESISSEMSPNFAVMGIKLHICL